MKKVIPGKGDHLLRMAAGKLTSDKPTVKNEHTWLGFII